jgi:hypothetical protein
MKVARYEVPGNETKRVRPGGDDRNVAIGPLSRYNQRQAGLKRPTQYPGRSSQRKQKGSIVPPGRMRSFASYPALRTGLLSERPSGTKIFQVFNDQPPASGAYILGALHLPDNPG